MGIDVYMTWDDQTVEEQDAQITGFQINKGGVGYLREAYHGKPYSTEVLVPEGFDKDGVQLDASLLEARLPAAIEAAVTREINIYHATPDEARAGQMVASLRAFVKLARKKQDETGKPVTIIVSA